MTSAVVGGEWSASRPGGFTLGERAPGTHLDRRLDRPQRWSARCGEIKILDCTGTRTPTPRSSSRVASRHTDCATKLNSMVWVRERTIPTERSPLVGEAIANFVRIEGATRSSWRIPPAVFSRFTRQEPLLFYQVASQLYWRGWVNPVQTHYSFFFW
jgi:hypothetical protein